MERCPNCKATNPGTSECRRCGIELVSLLAIEDEAWRLTLQALRLLASDPALPQEAAGLLAKAQILKHDALATVLQEFIASIAYDVACTKGEDIVDANAK